MEVKEDPEGDPQIVRGLEVRGKEYGFMIQYPGQGDPECTDVYPYGDTDSTVMNHTVLIAGGTNHTPDSTYLEDGFWALEFTDVLEDSAARLEVGENSSEASVVFEIDEDNC